SFAEVPLVRAHQGQLRTPCAEPRYVRAHRGAFDAGGSSSPRTWSTTSGTSMKDAPGLIT
ncbi:MAG: hypothetical protein ACOX69_09985, partial [Coriobacteriales bacterium]